VKELASALEERARPEGLAWLRETSASVAGDPTAIRSRFPMVGRKVGREPLDPAADPDDVHAWTIDDAARTLLLVAMGDAAEGELAELYRYGDAAERRGILRALPYLDLGDRALGLFGAQRLAMPVGLVRGQRSAVALLGASQDANR